LGFLLENIPSGKPGYVRKNDWGWTVWFKYNQLR
jgi:hypothetical protein